MKTNTSINIIDILNKAVNEVADSVATSHDNELRAEFNTRLQVIELQFEAENARRDAELEELKKEIKGIIADMHAWQANLHASQDELIKKQKTNDAEINAIVRGLATDFFVKYYEKDDGSGLIGRQTEPVVKEFYQWCEVNRISVPSGKGQKKVVTNTAKELFDLKLVNHHSVYARVNEGETDAE